MRVVVQRSKEACCTVDGKKVGSIAGGLVLLVGFTEQDDASVIDWMVHKVTHLRIFDDENHVMNLSLLDVKKEVLSISQFTLYGDCVKGNRPSYLAALNGEKARLLYDLWNQKLKEVVPASTGQFGADMQITFTNDGPVTILLER